MTLFIAMLFMGQHLYSICSELCFTCWHCLSQNSGQADLESIKPLIPVLLITAILDLHGGQR
ncbi:MAG: hypothetical protein ACLT3Y_11520 [Ruminococcus callidus]